MIGTAYRQSRTCERNLQVSDATEDDARDPMTTADCETLSGCGRLLEIVAGHQRQFAVQREQIIKATLRRLTAL